VSGANEAEGAALVPELLLLGEPQDLADDERRGFDDRHLMLRSTLANLQRRRGTLATQTSAAILPDSYFNATA